VRCGGRKAARLSSGLPRNRVHDGMKCACPVDKALAVRKQIGKVLAMAVAAAGITWTFCLRDTEEARSAGRRPVARVIAVSGVASVHWNGRSRPLAAGSGVEAGEVIVTGVSSTVLVGTADGGEFKIFSESQVKFRDNRRMWLDQVDRWLNGIKIHVQRFGGPPPSGRLSFPTAVMAVRASIFFPSSVAGVAELADFIAGGGVSRPFDRIWSFDHARSERSDPTWQSRQQQLAGRNRRWPGPV
jgi:hypothetical protein